MFIKHQTQKLSLHYLNVTKPNLLSHAEIVLQHEYQPTSQVILYYYLHKKELKL